MSASNLEGGTPPTAQARLGAPLTGQASPATAAAAGADDAPVQAAAGDPFGTPAAVRWPWLAAARPQTLPVGAVPVVVATALAAHEGTVDPVVFVCALLGAAAIQIGTNLFNDWADARRGADGPDRLGPPRMTQQGILPSGQVLGASLLAFAVASMAGLVLLQRGGALVAWVGTLSIAAGLAYTAGPLPLAYHGLGDLFAFAFFGPVAVVTTYVLHRGHAPFVAWAMGGALGAFSCAVLVVNNLRDRISDARVGKRTLAVRLGPRASRQQYVACLGLAYALTGACATAQWHVGARPTLALPWLSLPLAVVTARQMGQSDGRALNPSLGQTARLEALFGALACLGALWAQGRGAPW